MGINDILAAIDNMKRVGGRNIGDLGRDPIGALSKIASNVKEQLGTEEGTKEFMYNSMTPGVGGIIKSKGGNWLTGSVENALSGLKKRPPLINNPTPEVMNAYQAADPRAGALNNWIEGPLTKYIKRDMATEGDPVRKLAEQGVLHIQPETGFNSNLVGRRQGLGYSGMGVAKSPTAQSWEGLADNAVGSYRADSPSMVQRAKEIDPWIAKLEPDTQLYAPSIARENINNLGFNHLTDELSNALNPESGLPRHLQLTPEQMQQLGMEKAVRHVADINAWRAAQQAEANLAKSQSPAVHIVREYTENNPKGLRWTELRQPDNIDFNPVVGQTASGKWVLRDEQGLLKGKEFSSEQEAIDSLTSAEKRRYLADQLKYEGDTMGHCVGDYCDDVASGTARIFSLRDAKGEPHVTIETAPKKKGTHIGYDDNDAPVFLDEDMPTDIIQIKGKQNRKPNDEYLSFVQDFVKNHPEGGQWGDVGDIQNTGLIKVRPEMYPDSGMGEYTTQAELDAWNAKRAADAGVENFAEGGLVTGNYEPLDFDGVRGYILR